MMGEKIIVVGSSTGGTEALKVFLSGMPNELAGHPHCAAHAGIVHQIVCRTAGSSVRDAGEGGGTA